MSATRSEMPCPGCGASMPVAGDRCPSCGRENEIVKAFESALDSVARGAGWESFADAQQAMAVVGPILARQVKRAAAGLASVLTAFFVLFEQDNPANPVNLGNYVGVIAVLVAIFYCAFWWLLGGRNTGNPFATVRPIQLWLRQAGRSLLWPGLAALVLEVAYFATTNTRLCFCE